MSSQFPEWARRDERAREASRLLFEKVQGQRVSLEALFAEYAVREAFLFGSVARGQARSGSDVDIAVAGCPPGVFYRLAAKLERALRLPVDVSDLDTAPPDFAEPIRDLGHRLYPPPSVTTEGV